MKYGVCVSCGVPDGEIVDRQQMVLENIDLLPREFQDSTGRGTIWICQVCVRHIGFDMNNLRQVIAESSKFNRASVSLVIELIKVFIRDLWPGFTPPTAYDICEMLHRCNLQTQTGKPWTYHNLRNFMITHGIYLEEMFKAKNLENVVDTAKGMLVAGGYYDVGGVWIKPPAVKSLPVPMPAELPDEIEW